jgi:hypothetical protein
VGQVEVDQRDGPLAAEDHVARVVVAVADQLGPFGDRASRGGHRGGRVPPHTAPGGGTHPADATCSARISRARAACTSSPAVSGGSGLRGTSPGTNYSTSRPWASTPSGSGAPVNPASRRWARYACTVRLNGRSGRRTVSPIRTIPQVTPSPVSSSPSVTPHQPGSLRAEPVRTAGSRSCLLAAAQATGKATSQAPAPGVFSLDHVASWKLVQACGWKSRPGKHRSAR